MHGAPDNRATQMSLTLTLSRQRERELEQKEIGMKQRNISPLLTHKVLTGAKRRILSSCGQTGSPKPAGGFGFRIFFLFLPSLTHAPPPRPRRASLARLRPAGPYRGDTPYRRNARREDRESPSRSFSGIGDSYRPEGPKFPRLISRRGLRSARQQR